MRLAYFIAQVAHESHEFRTTTEYASGRAYEGRKNLGNTEPGDGPRFKGRGDIQLTGRYNYTSFTEWLKNRLGADTPDFVKNPELVAERPWATWATIYYWHSNNLNQWADKGYFKTLTMRINGGLNGYDDRLRHFNNFWPLVKDGLIFRDVV
jgi:putative chitinase